MTKKIELVLALFFNLGPPGPKGSVKSSIFHIRLDFFFNMSACYLIQFFKTVWTEWRPLNTPVYMLACAKLGDTVVVGGGFSYNPSRNLDETTIIDLNSDDGSNVVAAGFNTPRYNFEMINLHGLIFAFGGYDYAKSAALFDFEIWSPTLRQWAKGHGVFSNPRTYFGLLTLTLPKYYCDLEQSYEEWVKGIQDRLDETISTGGDFCFQSCF